MPPEARGHVEVLTNIFLFLPRKTVAVYDRIEKRVRTHAEYQKVRHYQIKLELCSGQDAKQDQSS